MFDADEELRRAIDMRAAGRGLTRSELLVEMLRPLFKKELAEVRRLMRQEGEDEPAED